MSQLPVSERLTCAPRRLLQAKGLQTNYRTLREMAVDARIPAHQVNTIWHYSPADLDEIADAWQQRSDAAAANRYAAQAA